ncbi:hypothetical protein SPI_04284 [Niveomyces insectorum RCEF 264]|uniref:Calcineurin-like phosphoesterase domain-containing protein n=1 Tax=Niveomyces insectorum RCEF 264 TaxID=1081102 RepID=A0A167VL38_9HYPO|nr:hypothetical protein SPI_04284 [Niveomyces insectorum RCEF 264]
MSPALFQIISDLHLETRASYGFALKQTAPNLALLGDIGQVVDNGLFVFLEKQLRRYWNVLFVLGNHEPALTSWPEAKRRVRSFADRMENLRARSTIGRFVFLDQTRYDVDDTLTILGCTLFSAVMEAQRAEVSGRFVDFKQIQQWDVDDHIRAHASDLNWLNTQVTTIAQSEPHRKIVIFTHHSPSVDERTIDERHRDSPVSSGFSTDLCNNECWTNPSVVMWAFGHTHFNCDFVDHVGKRIVTNQLGYALLAETTFDAKKSFLLGA